MAGYDMNKRFKLVEKKNQLAIHGLFDSYERAKYHLDVNIPEYILLGYFVDKTLGVADFEIMVA